MSTARSIASVSFDLDNQWTYMKTHGDAGWQSFPSYLDVLVPRVLGVLSEHNLTVTFFVVGQDAALDQNREPLQAIAEAGHEIGNHSFRHEPWLHLYSEAEVQTELERAEDEIARATGKRPLGFRGPGYSLSSSVIATLANRGYLYDASTLPTVIGPLARQYYFRTAKLSPEDRRKRSLLYGKFRDGFQPLKAYKWQVGASELLEIPVTTLPLLRLPIHVSYLLYISGYSKTAALAYFRAAVALCRWTGVQPSLLLHPLDFLGRDDVRELAFFPGMHLASEQKIDFVGEALEIMRSNFDCVTMEQHARTVAAFAGLPVRDLLGRATVPVVEQPW